MPGFTGHAGAGAGGTFGWGNGGGEVRYPPGTIFNLRDIAGNLFAVPAAAAVLISVVAQNGVRRVVAVPAHIAQQAIASAQGVVQGVRSDLATAAREGFEVVADLARNAQNAFLPNLGAALGISSPIVIGALIVLAVLMVK